MLDESLAIAAPSSSPFLRLPGEIRLKVYQFVQGDLVPARAIRTKQIVKWNEDWVRHQILLTSRQCYIKRREFFYALTTCEFQDFAASQIMS